MKKWGYLLSVCALCAFSAQAKVSPEHRKAALELFETSAMKQSMKASQDRMLQMVLQPLSAHLCPAAQKELQLQMNNVFSYNAQKDMMVGLYAKYFTAGELKEIARFYETDTGKKTLTVMPAMMQEAMVMGQQIIMSKQQDIQKAVSAAQQSCTAK